MAVIHDDETVIRHVGTVIDDVQAPAPQSHAKTGSAKQWPLRQPGAVCSGESTSAQGCVIGGRVKGQATIPLAIALLCSGCALFNPYRMPKDAQGKVLIPVIEGIQFAGGVEKAVVYADAWRVTYINAAATHSKARNVTAAVILPLTAASLFYGITDHGSSDRITRMALGGGMLYTGTEFLTSKPRQQLYLAGARALTCAIVATRPYMVTTRWEEAFNDKQGDLDAALAELARNAAALSGAIDMAETDAKTDKLKAQISTAKRIHAQAEQAMRDGRALADQASSISMAFAQVGHALLGTVRAITDRVDKELPKTEPDLEALKSMNSGMEGLSASLAGSAWPKPPTEAPTSSGTSALLDATRSWQSADSPSSRRANLAVAQQAVVDAQSALAAEGERLRTDIQTISKLEKVAKPLPDCVPEDLGVPFTLTPAGESLSITKGKTAVVFASGGAGVPGYQLSGANTDAVSIAPTVQRAALLSLTITASKSTPKGTGPTLSITDGSALQRFDVKIEVTD